MQNAFLLCFEFYTILKNILLILGMQASIMVEGNRAELSGTPRSSAGGEQSVPRAILIGGKGS